jgi:hypothetical protein
MNFYRREENIKPNMTVGGTCRRNLWEEPVGGTCGRNLWEAPVGGTCGRNLWEEPVGGIGAAGRDCFGIVQILNNRTAHSPDYPLDRFPVSPCPCALCDIQHIHGYAVQTGDNRTAHPCALCDIPHILCIIAARRASYSISFGQKKSPPELAGSLPAKVGNLGLKTLL